MANNDFGPGSVQGDLARANIYSEKVWREQLPSLFISNFATIPTVDGVKTGKATYIHDKNGEQIGVKNSSNEAIQMIHEFDAQRGDRIQFAAVQPLVGEGITGSSRKRMIDNAEQIQTDVMEVTLEEYGHALNDVSPLGRKRLQFDVMKEYVDQLHSWMYEKIEKLMIAELYNSPTTIIYPGAYTQNSDITATDLPTLALIRLGKAIAETRGSSLRNIVKPIRTARGPRYIALMDPDTLLQLKEDSEYKQWVQTAGVRGAENEGFTGAEFITFDGIVCYKSEYVPRPTDYGTGAVPGARIKLFGQSALMMGFGQNPMIQEETSDFGREKHMGVRFMLGLKKPNAFDKDFGSVEIRVARKTTVMG